MWPPSPHLDEKTNIRNMDQIHNSDKKKYIIESMVNTDSSHTKRDIRCLGGVSNPFRPVTPTVIPLPLLVVRR